jgi:hypothetical protein
MQANAKRDLPALFLFLGSICLKTNCVPNDRIHIIVTPIESWQPTVSKISPRKSNISASCYPKDPK